MFNKELMKERESLVLKSLIEDEVSSINYFYSQNFSEEIPKFDKEELLNALKFLYASIDCNNVLNIPDEFKTIIIFLLTQRINCLLESQANINVDTSEDFNFDKMLIGFCLEEYKILLNKFTNSLN